MTQEQLKQSAHALIPPSSDAAIEFAKKSEVLAEKMNEYFELRTDLQELIGDKNIDMMKNNHRNHAKFMKSLLANYSGDVLTETVLWVFRAYRNHGFNLAYWPAQLDIWTKLMKENMSESSCSEILPIYEWMIVHNPIFAKLSDEVVLKNIPKHD